MAKISLRNHALYAHAHGYSHLVAGNCSVGAADARELLAIHPAAWAKVFLLRRCLAIFPSLEHLLWVDADALVSSPCTSVEDLLRRTNSSRCAEPLG